MPTWNDGGLRWGARKIKVYSPGAVDGNGNTTWTTVKTGGGIYILENISMNRPGFVARQYNEIRTPNGALGLDDFVEGSATVQFGPGQVFLSNGDAFNTAMDNSPGGTAEGFVITSCDEPEAQGDIRKQNIRFQKIYTATPPTAYP